MVSYIRGRTRTLSDAEIVAAYVGGEDSNGIAHRANCDASTVLYLVRRAGHEVRPRGTRSQKSLAIPDEEIARLYRIGTSGPVIAGLAGVTVGTIYNRLHRMNVKLRPAHEVASARAAASRAARMRKKPP